MKVMICGRWNRHSSSHPEAHALWKTRNAHDAGKASGEELAKAQDALTVQIIKELDAEGVDVLESGGIRWDSVYDVARRIGGCEGFAMLSRIPETNNFHRQPVVRLPLTYGRSLRVDDVAFAAHCTKKPQVLSLPGPYTMARQTRNIHEVGLEKFSLAYAGVLRSEIEALLENGAMYVRIEEPQILGHPEDLGLFSRLMQELTEGLDARRIILATWFADIPEPQTYFALPFGGFQVDFVEGRNAFDALEHFPKDKMLVAGIVDARQPTHEPEELLGTRYWMIRRHLDAECIMLSPNADLHFLPWDEALQKVKRLVAFAGICEAPFSPTYKLLEPYYQRVQVAIPYPSHEPHTPEAPFGASRMSGSIFSIAEALKHQTFPTSTVGSFPQPTDVRKARVALRKREMTNEQYRQLVEDHTWRWMCLQEELDITVPVGGEFLREDMAAYFGVKFGGTLCDFVPSYENRRYRPVCYERPIPKDLDQPLIVDDFKFLQSLTSRPLKETLTGPATLADWGLTKLPEYWKHKGLFKHDLACALRGEIERLIASGARIIQIDEPALTTKMRGFASDIAAIYESFAGLEDKAYFILHICYSDMEALDQAFPHLLELPFHQIHMEMANRNYALLSLIEKFGFGGSPRSGRAGKDIGLGVLDVHTDRIETVEEICEGVAKTLAVRHDGKPVFRPEQIWLTPDCGLKERSEEVSMAKLRAMCEAAKICRARYG